LVGEVSHSPKDICFFSISFSFSTTLVVVVVAGTATGTGAVSAFFGGSSGFLSSSGLDLFRSTLTGSAFS